jgi:hypothetical protein
VMHFAENPLCISSLFVTLPAAPAWTHRESTWPGNLPATLLRTTGLLTPAHRYSLQEIGALLLELAPLKS